MATLTVRIPDDKHLRLKELAESQGISVNKLIEELSTVALVEFDTYTRFKLMAAQGDVMESLRILDNLDSRDD
jgi:predicted transcriptional regulator